MTQQPPRKPIAVLRSSRPDTYSVFSYLIGAPTTGVASTWYSYYTLMSYNRSSYTIMQVLHRIMTTLSIANVIYLIGLLVKIGIATKALDPAVLFSSH